MYSPVLSHRIVILKEIAIKAVKLAKIEMTTKVVVRDRKSVV